MKTPLHVSKTIALFLLANSRIIMFLILAAWGIWFKPQSSSAVTVTVPGTADPWLAGMPDGTLSNVGTPESADQAPWQSPVIVQGLAINPGDILNWSANGLVGHPVDIAGPDGAPGLSAHLVGAEHGISDVTSPLDSLLGVFLAQDEPDLTPAPATLDFSTPVSRDYIILAPALKQVFFMGDGLTTAGQRQSVLVPPGATRLFLGTMDGYGWWNNNGEF